MKFTNKDTILKSFDFWSQAYKIYFKFSFVWFILHQFWVDFKWSLKKHMVNKVEKAYWNVLICDFSPFLLYINSQKGPNLYNLEVKPLYYYNVFQHSSLSSVLLIFALSILQSPIHCFHKQNEMLYVQCHLNLFNIHSFNSEV